MSTHQQQLASRIEDFRKKYYTDKIIRGSLILALITSTILFVVLLSEGFFGFSSTVRTTLVFGLGLTFVAVLGYMVLLPIAQLFNWTKNISDLQIAQIVKTHFPNINDKLLNFLQLRKEPYQQGTLVAAALDNKALEIAPVKLSSAINFNVNRRYLGYLLVPILLFLLTYVADPSLLSGSGHRLINYKSEFAPPAPFLISLNDIPNEIVSGQNLELTVQVNGNELPADLFLYLRKSSESQFLDYTLEKRDANTFTYTIEDVKEDFAFYIGNPEVTSSTYEIGVLKRPFIRNFQIQLIYPAYTKLEPEVLDDNVGDFKAIKGTQVKWILEPQGDIDQAHLVADEAYDFERNDEKGVYQYNKQLMQDMNYFISLKSPEDIPNIDTVRYQASVLQDRYPSIYVFSAKEEFKIDLDPRMPIDLEIADDFGFTKMELHYRFVKSGGTSEVSETYSNYLLDIDKNILLQPLNYNVDLTQLGLTEGDEVEYFIKVWDNDAIAGPKSTVSPTYRIVYPTLDEKYDEISEDQDEVAEQFENIQKKAADLEESYKKLKEKLLDKTKLSFDDKKELERMLEEHQQMMEEVQKAQKQFEKNKDKLQQNQMISEETLQKYDELNEFLEEMENEKLEELLEQLREQMEELNPEDLMEQLEQLQMNDEDIRKSIERTMELMKQLEVDQKVDELQNKLENMKAKEDILNEKLEKSESEDELKQNADRQKDLESQMEKFQKDLEELQNMKDETKTPDEESMKELQEDAEEAQQEMEEAAEQTEEAAEKQEQSSSEENSKKEQKSQQQQSKQAQQKASDSQKKASQKMSEMSEKLGQMRMDMQMQQDQQNLESLRELLENLLKLSFDQEDLRDEVKDLRYGDPALGDRSKDQKKLQDDMELVRDSLEALGKKVFMIQKQIMDETNTITESMDKSQRFFRNKQVQMVTYHQQTAMTSINNLANMLSDVMQQMQQNMMNAMANPSMCQKPGQKPSPSIKGLSEQQRQLNQKLEQMMQQGQKMDQEALGEMARQQQAIREQMEQARQQMEQEGQDALGDLGKVAEDMKESEEDMANKQLTEELMMRQQQILSRMLQADRSVREREYDNKRESRTAEKQDKRSPDELTLEEYKNKIRQELLKSNKLEYSNDFIILIEQYFKKLEQTNE